MTSRKQKWSRQHLTWSDSICISLTTADDNGKNRKRISATCWSDWRKRCLSHTSWVARCKCCQKVYILINHESFPTRAHHGWISQADVTWKWQEESQGCGSESDNDGHYWRSKDEIFSWRETGVKPEGTQSGWSGNIKGDMSEIQRI